MIVLDVETTGLSPERCSILSLGAVDLTDPTNQFYEECRAWEGAHVSEAALAINGFSKAETAGTEKQSEAELIASFIAWATDRPQDRTLAAQNVSFDLEFVQQACLRAGLECPFAKRTLDVHTLAWLHMTGRGIAPPLDNHHSAISLDAALRYCGIPEEPKPHNALTGALCHAEVIARIAYNKKIFPEFSSYDIPWLTNPS
jgi:DNA polymerase III epsilon subunit-like protein